jgi:hypothetical protein
MSQIEASHMELRDGPSGLRPRIGKACHSAIAYFPQGAGIGYFVQRLRLLFEVYTAEEMRGRVGFL